MKKILTLIAAAFVAAGSFMFTACDIADEFIAPKDTWVYKASTTENNSFTYTWGEGENVKTVNFDVYVNYATAASVGDINFANGGKKTITEGVNLILVPSADTEEDKNNLKELLQASTNITNICLFYSFGKSSPASASTSESDTGTTQSLTETAWTWIYNLNHFERYTEKQFSQFIETLTVVDASTNLSWKRVLYNLLGEQLLGE